MTTPSESPGLHAHNVDFAYGGDPAVCAVSIGVRPAEMLALAGPNGSGKTTTLKLLSGARRPAGGTVTLDGVPLGNMSPRERARRVAFVAQQPESHLAFSVAQMVGMGRAPHMTFLAAPGRHDRHAIESALVSVDLEDRRSRLFSDLSGGEQQRVMIAMALAQDADYLLLDEPTVHLDLGHQHKMLELLCRLRDERNLGVIAVLHDLNLAMLYFERLAVLSHGRLLAHGHPTTITADRQTLAVFDAPLDVVDHPSAHVPQVLIRRAKDR
ncbi:MAG: ABC transporter ATP-binding protein [Chloroflexota bacterium]